MAWKKLTHDETLEVAKNAIVKVINDASDKERRLDIISDELNGNIMSDDTEIDDALMNDEDVKDCLSRFIDSALWSLRAISDDNSTVPVRSFTKEQEDLISAYMAVSSQFVESKVACNAAIEEAKRRLDEEDPEHRYH